MVTGLSDATRWNLAWRIVLRCQERPGGHLIWQGNVTGASQTSNAYPTISISHHAMSARRLFYVSFFGTALRRNETLTFPSSCPARCVAPWHAIIRISHFPHGLTSSQHSCRRWQARRWCRACVAEGRCNPRSARRGRRAKGPGYLRRWLPEKAARKTGRRWVETPEFRAGLCTFHLNQSNGEEKENVTHENSNSL
jgi:hypothetical protein